MSNVRSIEEKLHIPAWEVWRVQQMMKGSVIGDVLRFLKPEAALQDTRQLAHETQDRT